MVHLCVGRLEVHATDLDVHEVSDRSVLPLGGGTSILRHVPRDSHDVFLLPILRHGLAAGSVGTWEDGFRPTSASQWNCLPCFDRACFELVYMLPIFGCRSWTFLPLPRRGRYPLGNCAHGHVLHCVLSLYRVVPCWRTAAALWKLGTVG